MKDAIGDAILATNSVAEWLKQFHPNDLETARELLCSLRLIGTSEYDELRVSLSHPRTAGEYGAAVPYSATSRADLRAWTTYPVSGDSARDLHGNVT
jgi:hypothetical protein